MKKIGFLIVLLTALSSCGGDETRSARWPYGVNYEVFVRSFADGNGDGIGDFKGLTAKLDYFKDLGIGGLWLMPVMPSDTYHKYHVIDYRNIDPEYGTLDDFREFVRQAHQRNIRVITDFVINHTGNNHPWFLEASKGKDNPYRDYYVWAKMDSIKGTLYKQHISEDSYNLRKWHPVNGDTLGEQYYGYFNGLCPDLNMDNPKVKEEIVDIAKFWLNDLGVDGFRLDAARHIFPEDRTEDNHAYWVWFRQEMEKIKPDVYLVGEVWAPAKVVAPYLKGLPSLFNFDLGGSIMTDVKTGFDTVSLVDQYKKTVDVYKAITPQYLDATFVRNHDQPRMLTELKGNQMKSRMATGILMTMPGTPYIYYGEEIGMLGDKSMNYETILGPDIYIREPFLWDDDSKDPVQTHWMKAEFSTDASVTPYSRQKDDPTALYQFYRKWLSYRNRNEILTYGDIVSITPKYRELVSFVRTYEGKSVLVVHNISDVEVTARMEGEWAPFQKIDFDSNGSASLEGGALKIPANTSLVLNKQ
ncbi:MAG: alpha-amylase [Bacteroidetes bacterium]|nr:alpha-amylase [Bacteroidota bacterium]